MHDAMHVHMYCMTGNVSKRAIHYKYKNKYQFLVQPFAFVLLSAMSVQRPDSKLNWAYITNY
jgi:hypothetical protein